MATPTPASEGLEKPLSSKADQNGNTTGPAGSSAKSVQIEEPLSETPDELPYIKQFPASFSGRRLSGRPPPARSSSKTSIISETSLENLDKMVQEISPVLAAEDLKKSGDHHQHRAHRASERLLAQVAEWIQYEKTKIDSRRAKKASRNRKTPSGTATSEDDSEVKVAHRRQSSIDSQSSEVSLDRLQQILNDSMTALGLKSLPHPSPRLGHRHRKKSQRSLRAAPSETELADSDPSVPSCDAFLDNSKAMRYIEGGTEDDSASVSSKRDEKDKQAWLSFKNEVIRLTHTLKVRGWRQVQLDGGESISVERLSGALTNAVYVVSPPKDMAPPPEGKRLPSKILLRVYGPQVDIDRDNELAMLARLARKRIGPRLLGTFSNGRFEQFFNAATLTSKELRDPETSKQIAKRMRELHDGIDLLDQERSQGPDVWRNWDRWVEQAEKTVTALDKQIMNGTQGPIRGPGDVWKRRGLVCGVEWHVFKAAADKARKYLLRYYGGEKGLRERLVFAHNDTQYGNILRLRPDNEESPLLQPANKHKQLIVIDFEYAGANTPGLEFANHFTEWMYNYHDTVAPFACKAELYPTPEEQHRFLKAYVTHRPKPVHSSSNTPTPALTPLTGPSTPALRSLGSTNSVSEFMLDARGAGSSWREEDARQEEETERQVKELLEETRLWRVANSAHWVAWGVVQAKIPGLKLLTDHQRHETEDGKVEREEIGQGDDGAPYEEEVEADEFDYLGYAQERALFFWGDCVQLGLIKAQELPEGMRGRIKIVHY